MSDHGKPPAEPYVPSPQPDKIPHPEQDEQLNHVDAVKG